MPFPYSFPFKFEEFGRELDLSEGNVEGILNLSEGSVEDVLDLSEGSVMDILDLSEGSLTHG